MFRVIMTIHEWILTADIIRWTDQTELPIDWRWWDFLIFPRCKSLLVRPAWNLCLMSLNHLLLVVNASVNFLIYCSIGRKFKGDPAVMRLKFELSFQWSPEKYFDCSTTASCNIRKICSLLHYSILTISWWYVDCPTLVSWLYWEEIMTVPQIDSPATIVQSNTLINYPGCGSILRL